MKECLFTVEQRDDRRWHVCQGGVPHSLASFGLREDALRFARELDAEEMRASERAKGSGRREQPGA